MMRKPDVLYVEPQGTERAKVCGACGKRWPRRLMRGGTWRCINCARKYERGRVRPTRAVRQNATVTDEELRDLLRAQASACPACSRRIVSPGDEASWQDAFAFRDGGQLVGAFCRRCFELVTLFYEDPVRFRRVLAHFDDGAKASASARVEGRRGSMSVHDPELSRAVDEDGQLSADVDRLIEKASRQDRRATSVGAADTDR